MVDERIVKFIKKHHLLSLATSTVDGVPYCSSAFYGYDSERNVLVFSANPATEHGSHMEQRAKVAATIALETKVVGSVKGLQISGEVVVGDDRARMTYIKRFPYALAMDLNIWMLKPSFLKFTDNQLGFGTKLIWRVQE